MCFPTHDPPDPKRAHPNNTSCKRQPCAHRDALTSARPSPSSAMQLVACLTTIELAVERARKSQRGSQEQIKVGPIISRYHDRSYLVWIKELLNGTAIHTATIKRLEVAVAFLRNERATCPMSTSGCRSATKRSRRKEN